MLKIEEDCEKPQAHWSNQRKDGS